MRVYATTCEGGAFGRRWRRVLWRVRFVLAHWSDHRLAVITGGIADRGGARSRAGIKSFGSVSVPLLRAAQRTERYRRCRHSAEPGFMDSSAGTHAALP